MAKRKLDSTQIADMIEYASRAPEDTGRSINADAFRVLGLDDNSVVLVNGPCVWL